MVMTMTRWHKPMPRWLHLVLMRDIEPLVFVFEDLADSAALYLPFMGNILLPQGRVRPSIFADGLAIDIKQPALATILAAELRISRTLGRSTGRSGHRVIGRVRDNGHKTHGGRGASSDAGVGGRPGVRVGVETVIRKARARGCRSRGMGGRHR